MSLSDKREERIISGFSYREEDVKEFIKELKKKSRVCSDKYLIRIIDELAGDKLIGGEGK